MSSRYVGVDRRQECSERKLVMSIEVSILEGNREIEYVYA